MSPLPCPAYVLLGAPLAALAAGFLFFHRRFPRLIHWPILLSCVSVTAASWWLAWRVLGGASWDQNLFTWMPGGDFTVPFGLRIDGLSASVLAMVSVVATLIHAYAVGYMEDDPGFSRFFLYFHFFFFSMVGLLVSNNYLQMYLFWEGVGLASFLLIGFWYEKESARAASWKAFLTNRIGDLGFMLAVFLMLRATGTTRFDDVIGRLPFAAPRAIPWIALLLFWGASAKSAQFPLHVWLPDAMEGPTPVSALIHAATMVTAGVFLMLRSSSLLVLASGAAALVSAVGALTAVGAALVAATRKDLKRILAYSTVSHLGLMMMAVGVGDVLAAVFHLIAHGFFKAVLFLCAGNVIHAVAHGTGKTSAGVDDVGALSGSLPWTFAAFFAGALALAGVPPLSGFFSKDMILEGLWAEHDPVLRAAGLLVAAGSSLYIFRMMLLTFFGRRPQQAGPSGHAHEPGLWMRIPVLLLAAGAAGAGALAGPLARMLKVPEPAFSWPVSVWGLSFAALGFAAAWAATMLKPSFDWEWRSKAADLERWLDSDLGWQPFAASLARAVGDLASLIARGWEGPWDRFTESLADTCLGLGEGLSGLTRGLLNDYLGWMVLGAAAFAFALVLCF